jgi:DNA (cytosine-5)-methyltransferase 1
VQHWDEWTAAMQAKHGNGNGHGKSLAIEALRLLPTPRADERMQHNSRDSGVALSKAVTLLPTPSVADGTGGHASRSGARKGELLLPGVAKLIGASTPLPSPAGNTSSDAEHLPLPSQDPKADNA